MTVREALNSALDEEMSADPKVFLMGEEVGRCQIFFPKRECFLFLFLCVSWCFLYMQVGEYQGAYKVRLVC